MQPDNKQVPKVDFVPEPETPTRWWTWVRTVAGEDTQLEIAHKSKLDKYHVTRWKQGWIPAAEFAVAFAEAYHRNPLEALVEAGYLTEEQAALQRVDVTDLTQVQTDELLRELRRRIPQ